MNTKRLTLTFAICALAWGAAFAQLSNSKRAKQLMEDLNYSEAITIYNQILEKKDDPEAKINIAECYRKVNDSENAEYWYSQVVRIPGAAPIYTLYYGQALQRNGKCELAREWYQKYVDAVPEDQRGQYLVKACDYQEELMTKNAGIYEVKNLEFNSKVDDFGPIYYGDGIIFASERGQNAMVKRTHAWTGNPFTELYFLTAEEEKGEECGNYTYGSPDKFSDDINSKFHDAAVALSSDQSTIFFTRNNFSEGKVGKSDDGTIKLKVYTATKQDDGKWDELAGLPFNSDEYSVAHPTLTVDGNRLYFSSDMPGGFGGMDLYYSDKENGNWGPPMNMGPDVNTEGNEVFPYYHNSGRFYFSSDGHVGLGGLDVYYMDDKGEGTWGPIENIGFPVNTSSDDFGIVFNEEGTCGHFSSDREGGVGRDDIYSLRKTASPLEVYVYDAETKEPIQNATVVEDCLGNILKTGEDGKAIIDMKMNLCCQFSANMEGYLDNAVEGCTKDIPVGEKVFVEIPLEREVMFKIEGIVFDQVTGLPIDGATVTLTNDCGDDEQTMVTDVSGNYTFELKEECCYTVKGTKEAYLADKATDQCTRGQEESITLQANLNLQPTRMPDPTVVNVDPDKPTAVAPVYNPDKGIYEDPVTGEPADGIYNDIAYKGGEPENETDVIEPSVTTADNNGLYTFILHIYYDFNQSYIRGEDENELDKLYGLMVDNPEYVMEIGSHTDSRGSYNYNDLLSQRRADAVVRWLTKKGINRNRLVPVGYGESQNVNDCKNRVPCSEQEHQFNRRTEFKILGTIGETIDSSKPQANPRVVPCASCPF